MTKAGNLNQNEIKVLAEIYRRLFFFKKGNVNDNLMLLSTPCKAKPIINLGLIKHDGIERNFVLNWYKLTEKGKSLFNLFPKKKLSDTENHNLFIGNIPIDLQKSFNDKVKLILK